MKNYVKKQTMLLSELFAISSLNYVHKCSKKKNKTVKTTHTVAKTYRKIKYKQQTKPANEHTHTHKYGKNTHSRDGESFCLPRPHRPLPPNDLILNGI